MRATGLLLLALASARSQLVPLTDSPALSLSRALSTGEPLIRHIYSADPAARVFDGILWLYVCHDPAESTGYDSSMKQTMFRIREYHAFSASAKHENLKNHGVVLSLDQVKWAKQVLMWAPDVVQGKDGRYHLYFSAFDEDNNFRIGSAESASPSGPFIADDNYIAESFSIDPSVYVDPISREGIIYFGGLWGGQLERWRGPTSGFMTELHTGRPFTHGNALGPMAAKLTPDFRSFDTEVLEIPIIDEHGVQLLASDNHRRFFEGARVFERAGIYYLLYSTGDTHKLVYAMADNAVGPFTYRGVLLEPVQGWTTHGSVVKFDSLWWLLYADASLSNGVSWRRSTRVAHLYFETDGNITVAHYNASERELLKPRTESAAPPGLQGKKGSRLPGKIAKRRGAKETQAQTQQSVGHPVIPPSYD